MMSKQEAKPAEAHNEILDEELLEQVSGGEGQMPSDLPADPEENKPSSPKRTMKLPIHWA